MTSSDNHFREALAACKGGFYSIGLFSAVINLLMLVPAIYMLQVYDRVLASGNTTTLIMLTLMVLGLYILMAALEWVRSYMVIRLGAQMDMHVNQLIYNAAFNANLSGHRQSAAQALKDLTHLRQFATGNAVFALFDAPWFPVYLAVLFLFHPWLGWLALAGALVLIGLAWLNQRLSHRPLEKAGILSIRATQHAEADLRHAEAAEAMGMLQALRTRWLHQHTAFLISQGVASEKTASITALSKGVRMSLQSLMLGLGAWLAVAGDITAGMMIAGSILVGRVLSPLDQVINAWKQWSGARLSYARLNQLMCDYPEQGTGMSLPKPRGAISVENITACVANSRTPVLNNVSFSVAQGEMIGVLGPSGSGKSTLAKVLVAAQSVLAGKVRLDGADMHQWDKTELGPHIGYLPQDVQLFAGSIAENIARFQTATPEEIVEASRLAGVHELILQLPDGYDTQLSETGAGLSGGQKQRIGLARALFRQPALVVLDEPDASLDDAGEKALLRAFKDLKRQQCTLIVITHKPALVNDADKLLVLRQGQLQAFDTPSGIVQAANTASAVKRPLMASSYAYKTARTA